MSARSWIGLRDKTFGYRLDRGLGVVIDSKEYGLPAAWYGTRCSRRTWGHAGYLCSVGFVDPENRLVLAAVFNGMAEDDPALHDARMRETIDAVYADLGLGPSQ